MYKQTGEVSYHNNKAQAGLGQEKERGGGMHFLISRRKHSPHIYYLPGAGAEGRGEAHLGFHKI